ncbi:hypothetical protein [Lutimonas sp.]|uniref:hypothetical protein n=1 Tax=Lutimonas sp. TaxID=1872403 RepID=UPI003D9B1FFF
MTLKVHPSILMLFCCACLYAQEPSEIYVFDLVENDSLILLNNPVNVSNNDGYDNQPAFSEDGLSLFFTSERDGQTDVAKYNFQEGYRSWVTNTPDSEYSPTSYPGKKKYFTCVRLNQDGSQYLYKYAYKNKEPLVLIPNLKVGYYLWINEKTLATFVIDDIETLQVSNFKFKIRYPIAKNIGRSLQNIPTSSSSFSNKMSYISLEHGSPEIYAIDPSNSEQVYITDPLPNSQDLAWSLKGKIIMGNETGIFQFTPGESKEWIPVKIETDIPMTDFSRLAVSPDGKKLAVVVSE